jgi:quercetin dioxygenase-like cupin family protein
VAHSPGADKIAPSGLEFGLHEQRGVELLYVLSGKVEPRTGNDRHELSEGDSIYFDSNVPHGYRKIVAKRTTALVVTMGTRDLR